MTQQKQPTKIHTINNLPDCKHTSFFETATIVGSQYFTGDYVIDESNNKLYIVQDVSEYKKDGYDGYVINVSFFAKLTCNIWVNKDKKILNEYIIRKAAEEINDNEIKKVCAIILIFIIILLTILYLLCNYLLINHKIMF